ncbi:hypothetical protein [Antarctobacter sp.]|uniref:hypothetical protein n=1 Tax=Antarctobacter sp. TaxID=1872577 RepID=UPI002B276CAE|nr:hypothetical protein [Antarctobacter sp.]
MQTIDYHDARTVLDLRNDQFRTLLDIWRGPAPVKRGGRGGPARYSVEELVTWLYKSLPPMRFNHEHELMMRQMSA